jgi:hypothetical protein
MRVPDSLQMRMHHCWPALDPCTVDHLASMQGTQTCAVHPLRLLLQSLMLQKVSRPSQRQKVSRPFHPLHYHHNRRQCTL